MVPKFSHLPPLQGAATSCAGAGGAWGVWIGCAVGVAPGTGDAGVAGTAGDAGYRCAVGVFPRRSFALAHLNPEVPGCHPVSADAASPPGTGGADRGSCSAGVAGPPAGSWAADFSSNAVAS